jgi:hypothetical protein
VSDGRAQRLGPVGVSAPTVLAGLCAAIGAMLLLTLLMGLAALDLRDGASSDSAAQSGVSAVAQAEIPAEYLRLYRQAAARYGLDWSILAGIGKVECDHGRDPDPSCTREGAVNLAGAGGPMQFLAPTWARYGVDGDGNGRADRWDPADAIYGAANYLRACDAPGDYRRAILAYNHAGWYVAAVERWAAVYRASEPVAGGADAAPEGADGAREYASPTPIQLIPGERALLSSDGHVALIPAAAPPVVQAMVIAGNELQELPYGPAGHPDPRGATSEDCSSTVSYVLVRAGVRPIGEILADNPLAQDYVRWGQPGPGRWVTIYATTTPSDHVFIVIAGLRLDTSHDGTDVGPNRDQDGPRWRVLDHIPAWGALVGAPSAGIVRSVGPSI